MDPTFTSRASGASRSPRPAFTVVGMALAVGLLATACGGSDPAAPPTSSTTEVPTTSTTVLPTPTTEAPGPEVEILEAVDGYWTVFFEANDPPDPSHPGFGQFYTGDAFVKSVGNAANRLSLGQAVRRGSEDLFQSRPTVVSLEGDAATVEDCVVDDSTLVDVASGTVLNDAVATSLMRLDLQRADGVWRIASNTVLARSDGAQERC